MTDLHWLSAVILLTLLAAFPYVVQRTLSWRSTRRKYFQRWMLLVLAV